MNNYGQENVSQTSKQGWFKHIWPFTGVESQRTFYFSVIFSCIIFSYSIIKPLKDTIFIGFIGPSYLPWAKLLMLASLPIFMPLYSAADNKEKRNRAIMIFSTFYGLVCLIFAVLFLSPTMGIANTATGPGRILGWIFYAIMDFFSIAVVATFWAMINSISTPNTAKKQYGIMVAASRGLGAIAAGLGTVLTWIGIKDTTSIPTMIALAGISLVLCTFLAHKMFKKIPQDHLKGYSDEHEKDKSKSSVPKNAWSNLKTLVTRPYTFGMFWLLCSFELISALMNYRMQCLIAQSAKTIGGIGKFMFAYTFIFQILGLLLALFGTTKLLKNFGVRFSLLLTPLIVLLLSFSLVFLNNLAVITTLMISLRTLNYSLDVPVKEILFIPTTHNIQYQVKGWIASFGKTISKTTGSLFNGIAATASARIFLRTVTYAPIVLSFFWILTAFIVGKTYKKAIDAGAVIGEDDVSTE
ncbi:Npt1/Npt2 family nucleotide transporter [Candidatus Dependentiae bacterium]